MSVRPVDLVLFDAVGTLIYPDPPVVDVYLAASRKIKGFGIMRDELSARFKEALRRSYQIQGKDCGGETSEAFELKRWLEIVRMVFREVDEASATMLFNELWQTFGEPGAWSVFPDVAQTMAELRRRGYQTGIASNFDQRLLKIIRCKEALAGLDSVFVSSALGWSKPAGGFYGEIERWTKLPPNRILLVGDDFENDVTAPRRFGWQSRWLVRDTTSSKFEHIRSLTKLLDQLPG